MTVFAAMLLDAYRELNSRRLFWITLGVSALVVIMYGSMGFNESGMFMFYGLWTIDSEIVREGSPYANLLYRSIFSSFIVSIWLAWVATILALISTTTIFPDFLASGAIELVLSKPVGRVRLFFYKYITSLLFVFLQVALFCIGVFLCMGIRLGEWEWKIFAAVPVIVAFYSYIFSVNVLVGTWTRSALTALLVTLIFWFSIFGVNQAEGMMNMFRFQAEISIEKTNETLALQESLLTAVKEREEPGSPAEMRIQAEIDNLTVGRDAQQEGLDKLAAWYGPIRASQVVLPKTGETIALLDRWLKRDDDVSMMDLMSGNVMPDGQGGFILRNQERQDVQVQQRLEEEYENRSEIYIAGTSLLFEAIVLALACWIFVRRDF